MNLKVFNLLSGINETRFLVQHESRECKYGLNESVCNLKQKNGTMMKKCKIVKILNCKNGYMWNPSTYDCECNKACKIDEYLDIKNCSCEKHVIGKLVLEYEDKILSTTETLLNNKKGACKK